MKQQRSNSRSVRRCTAAPRPAPQAGAA